MFAVDAAGHPFAARNLARRSGPRHGGLPDREEVPGQPGPRVRDDAVRLGAPTIRRRALPRVLRGLGRGLGVFVQAQERQIYAPVTDDDREHDGVGLARPGQRAPRRRRVREDPGAADQAPRRDDARLRPRRLLRPGFGPRDHGGGRARRHGSTGWPRSSRTSSAGSSSPRRRTTSCSWARRAPWPARSTRRTLTRGATSVRVNRYSVILARYHGLSEEEIRDIHVASLLHDVGKIGVDDAILTSRESSHPTSSRS